jgi:hypothetical protein
MKRLIPIIIRSPLTYHPEDQTRDCLDLCQRLKDLSREPYLTKKIIRWNTTLPEQEDDSDRFK